MQGVHPVKRHLATSGSLICLFVGMIVGLPATPAQAQQAAARPPATHQAVIDIGYIFKNHAQFKSKMDKMRDEVMAAENGLKAERDRINGLGEQLKGFNPGTPEFKKLEAEVAKAQGEFNVEAQLQKKDFMDREAAIYHEVFGQIEQAVAQFSQEHGIAVVHRFDGDPVDSGDRNQVLRGITKPLVYYDRSIDITPDVLRLLNAGAVASAPGQQPVNR
jgi:Skp family chaperone for outer membrane proteins